MGYITVVGLTISIMLLFGCSQPGSDVESTIFTYDGQDLVRTQTTLAAKDGESAVNTKLDRASPAYQALTQKRSYTGPATLFGREYEANYAPLTDEDGQLTGALFITVAK